MIREESWALPASSPLPIWEQSLQDRWIFFLSRDHQPPHLPSSSLTIIIIVPSHQAVGGIFASGTNVVVLAMGASATDAAFFCFVIRCCVKQMIFTDLSKHHNFLMGIVKLISFL